MSKQINPIKRNKQIITIICNFTERKIGLAATSPGLEYDAKLYIENLKQDFDVQVCNNWFETKKERDENINKIKKSDIIIGIEELGVSEYYPYYLDKYVILIPNLEIETPYVKRMFEKLPKLDLIISKTRENKTFLNLIKKYILKFRANFFPEIVFIPHLTPILDVPQNKSVRRNIIHFAGASPYKNTLEQTLAGIELVKKYPKYFDKLIVKVTIWRDNYLHPDFPTFTDKTLDKLAIENKDVFTYIRNGFISDKEKYDLLDSSILSLCCSNTEGFGHYIMESLARGCTVITTDGYPMNTLEGVLLVEPDKIVEKNCSLFYNVSADRIVKSVEENLEKFENFNWEENVKIYEKQKEEFMEGINELTEKLKEK
jgi:hypothetical protein